MTTEDHYLNVDEQKVKITLYLPDKKSKNQAVLFLHGWTGKPNSTAATVLADNGYVAATLIFRGHDGSDCALSEVTRQHSLDDAVAAYDFLREMIGASMPICVAGNSYGGYIATLLTAERRLNGLSMRVAANYIDEGFDQKQKGQGSENPEIAKWRLQKLGATETKSLRAVHSFSGKVQIIEAEFDDHVPAQTTKNYVQSVSIQSNLSYHLMKGWPHSLGLDAKRNEQFNAMLLKWLEEL